MKYGRRDKNQRPIVEALDKLPDVSVQDNADVGGGYPDLAVGYRGTNYYFEVKNPAMPPSKRKLTPLQVEWHQNWKGEAHVVLGYDEILKIIGYPVLL